MMSGKKRPSTPNPNHSRPIRRRIISKSSEISFDLVTLQQKECPLENVAIGYFGQSNSPNIVSKTSMTKINNGNIIISKQNNDDLIRLIQLSNDRNEVLFKNLKRNKDETTDNKPVEYKHSLINLNNSLLERYLPAY